MVAEGLAPMVAAGFLRELTKEVEEDTRKHVVGIERLRVVGMRNEDLFAPMAFLASAIIETSCYRPNDVRLFHLGGVIVQSQLQDRGIARKLLVDELQQTRATHLGFHTQNAHMLRLGDELSRYDYSISGGLAEELGTRQMQTAIVDDRSFIVDAGRYGVGGLYGDLNEFRQRRMSIRGLNTLSGDAVVYVGRVK